MGSGCLRKSQDLFRILLLVLFSAVYLPMVRWALAEATHRAEFQLVFPQSQRSLPPSHLLLCLTLNPLSGVTHFAEDLAVVF